MSSSYSSFCCCLLASYPQALGARRYLVFYLVVTLYFTFLPFRNLLTFRLPLATLQLHLHFYLYSPAVFRFFKLTSTFASFVLDHARALSSSRIKLSLPPEARHLQTRKSRTLKTYWPVKNLKARQPEIQSPRNNIPQTHNTRRRLLPHPQVSKFQNPPKQKKTIRIIAIMPPPPPKKKHNYRVYN